MLKGAIPICFILLSTPLAVTTAVFLEHLDSKEPDSNSLETGNAEVKYSSNAANIAYEQGRPRLLKDHEKLAEEIAEEAVMEAAGMRNSLESSREHVEIVAYSPKRGDRASRNFSQGYNKIHTPRPKGHGFRKREASGYHSTKCAEVIVEDDNYSKTIFHNSTQNSTIMVTKPTGEITNESESYTTKRPAERSDNFNKTENNKVCNNEKDLNSHLLELLIELLKDEVEYDTQRLKTQAQIDMLKSTGCEPRFVYNKSPPVYMPPPRPLSYQSPPVLPAPSVAVVHEAVQIRTSDSLGPADASNPSRYASPGVYSPAAYGSPDFYDPASAYGRPMIAHAHPRYSNPASYPAYESVDACNSYPAYSRPDGSARGYGREEAPNPITYHTPNDPQQPRDENRPEAYESAAVYTRLDDTASAAHERQEPSRSSCLKSYYQAVPNNEEVSDPESTLIRERQVQGIDFNRPLPKAIRRRKSKVIQQRKRYHKKKLRGSYRSNNQAKYKRRPQLGTLSLYKKTKTEVTSIPAILKQKPSLLKTKEKFSRKRLIHPVNVFHRGVEKIGFECHKPEIKRIIKISRRQTRGRAKARYGGNDLASDRAIRGSRKLLGFYSGSKEQADINNQQENQDPSFSGVTDEVSVIPAAPERGTIGTLDKMNPNCPAEPSHCNGAEKRAEEASFLSKGWLSPKKFSGSFSTRLRSDLRPEMEQDEPSVDGTNPHLPVAPYASVPGMSTDIVKLGSTNEDQASVCAPDDPQCNELPEAPHINSKVDSFPSTEGKDDLNSHEQSILAIKSLESTGRLARLLEPTEEAVASLTAEPSELLGEESLSRNTANPARKTITPENQARDGNETISTQSPLDITDKENNKLINDQQEEKLPPKTDINAKLADSLVAARKATNKSVGIDPQYEIVTGWNRKRASASQEEEINPRTNDLFVEDKGRPSERQHSYKSKNKGRPVKTNNDKDEGQQVLQQWRNTLKRTWAKAKGKAKDLTKIFDRQTHRGESMRSFVTTKFHLADVTDSDSGMPRYNEGKQTVPLSTITTSAGTTTIKNDVLDPMERLLPLARVPEEELRKRLTEFEEGLRSGKIKTTGNGSFSPKKVSSRLKASLQRLGLASKDGNVLKGGRSRVGTDAVYLLKMMAGAEDGNSTKREGGLSKSDSLEVATVINGHF